MQKALRAPSLLGWLTVHKHGLHERVLVAALCALDALVGLREGVRIQSPQRVCVRVLREDDRADMIAVESEFWLLVGGGGI
jgi:hypothetical protein